MPCWNSLPLYKGHVALRDSSLIVCLLEIEMIFTIFEPLLSSLVNSWVFFFFMIGCTSTPTFPDSSPYQVISLT